MWKYKTIALDYDGTLVEDVHPSTNGKIIEGADKFTQWLKSQGWEIIISTCRTNVDREELENNLKRQGIVYDLICFYTKPICSLMVDDKSIRFDGVWKDIKTFIEEKDKEEQVTEMRFYNDRK